LKVAYILIRMSQFNLGGNTPLSILLSDDIPIPSIFDIDFFDSLKLVLNTLTFLQNAWISVLLLMLTPLLFKRYVTIISNKNKKCWKSHKLVRLFFKGVYYKDCFHSEERADRTFPLGEGYRSGYEVLNNSPADC